MKREREREREEEVRERVKVEQISTTFQISRPLFCLETSSTRTIFDLIEEQ